MSTTEPAPPRTFFGLSGRLMWLTLLFVMLGEVLIFVPSVSNFRNAWFTDRLAAAQTAALVIEAAPAEAIPDALVERLLENVGAKLIALKIGGTRRLLAVNDTPPDVDLDVDTRQRMPLREIIDSFSTMLNGGNRTIRVVGPAPMGGEFIELVLSEQPLRAAMLTYSRNILLVSLAVSGLAGALVYATLHSFIVLPVKRLATSLNDFSTDTARVLAPSERSDEIGEAERSLARMQQALRQQIKQQQHLANLGLAVAKINHDLRNLLTAAHLLSDRIASVSDPTVQRIAPKLISALDRAVNFCQATLAYGKAEERPPAPRKFDFNKLVNDLRDLMALDDDGPVKVTTDIAMPFVIHADPDQLLRVMMNVVRNSLEVLAQQPCEDKRLTFAARRIGDTIEIDLCDSGPGIPAERRPSLFRPFSASRTIGGTGLGLTIAAELMQAQRGTIKLIDRERGTCFRLTLPG